MVVATEFYDRRPRREPAPARRLTVPQVQLSWSSSAPEDESKLPQPSNIDHSEAAQLVRAWETIQARVTTLQGSLVVATDCNEEAAAALLQHLPGYLPILWAEKVVQKIFQKPYRYWTVADKRQIDKALASCDLAIGQIAEYIEHLQNKPERLQRLVSDITEYGPGDSSTQWYAELTERRAYLRSHVNRAQLKLRQLPDRTPREEKLEKLLPRFLPLEDFPHQIDNPTDATALHEVLLELEPLFISLEPSFTMIREVSEVVTLTDEVMNTTTVEAGNKDDTSNTGDEVNTVGSAHAVDTDLRSDPAFAPLAFDLGVYEAQPGESLYDVVVGDAYAAELPILSHLSSAARIDVVNEVITTLDASVALCTWIGLPFPGSDLPNELSDGKQFAIDLDRLQDLVTLIAADQGVIKLPANVQQRLVDLITRVLRTQTRETETGGGSTEAMEEVVMVRSIEDLWPAFRAFFGTTTLTQRTTPPRVKPLQSLPEQSIPAAIQQRVKRLEADVIRLHYDHDEHSFLTAAQTWLVEQMLVSGRSTEFTKNQPEVINVARILEPMQMMTLSTILEPNKEQQRWLQLHGVPKRDWLEIVQTIKEWQIEIEAEQCFHPLQSFGEIGRVIFALRAIDQRMT